VARPTSRNVRFRSFRAPFARSTCQGGVRGEGGRSVLVGAERVGRGAGVADRCRGVEGTQRDRHAAIGEKALDVVQPIGAALELDEAAEGAPFDSLRREPVRVNVRRHDRKRQCHGGWQASSVDRSTADLAGGR